MTAGAAGGRDGSDEAPVQRSGASDPNARPPRSRDDEALHPARHLRQRQWDPAADPFSAGEPVGEGAAPGAPSGGAAAHRTSRSGVGAAADGSFEPAGRAPGRYARLGRRAALVTVLGLAVAVGAISGAVALLEQSHPTVVSSLAAVIPAASAGDGIGNLRMYSTTTGWSQRLQGGTVLHTTRGVRHWTASSPPSSDQILAVAYVDARTARVLTVPSEAGSQATVQSWATTDGGASWSRGGTIALQSFSPAVGGALDFVDAEHGWYSQLEAAAGVAGTALYSTVDGGAHWTEVAVTGGGAAGVTTTGAIPGSCDGLTAAFVSDTTGWLTGTCLSAAAPLYVTRDGGETWTAQSLPTLAPSPAGGTSFSPLFTSKVDGTLFTENQSLTGVSTSLFATSDGGLSWLPRSTVDGSPVTDEFLDPDHGWLVVAADGVAGGTDLYQTGDGGKSWGRVGAFPYMGLNLDFLTPDAGWASVVVGQQVTGPAYLIQTGDGGRTWTGVVPTFAIQPSPSP